VPIHRLLTIVSILLISMTANAGNNITRYKNPAHMTEAWAREFSESIEIPAGVDQLLLSGVGPMIADAAAPADTVQSYGDTEVQTRSVLLQIKSTLEKRGYAMGDIVSMQALIVGDPRKGGEADFAGFSKVYNQFFGTKEQPNVPVRTRAQVVRLVPPGWLVEITVTVAKRRP